MNTLAAREAISPPIRGLICVFVVLAALAAWPAAATPVGDAGAVGMSGEPEGPAEEDDVYYIPAEIFLQHLKREPDFRDKLADRVLALRRFLRRNLAALRQDLLDAGYDPTREAAPPPPIDVAQELAAAESSAAAERARALAARVRAANAQAADELPTNGGRDPDDIGVQGAAMLGVDLPGDGLSSGGDGPRSPTAGTLPPRTEGASWGPFKILLDVLRWMRSEIWLCLLVGTTLALFAWMRQAARRE